MPKMRKGKSREIVSIQEVASLGGKARAAKYSREQLREWGKKGGRPLKTFKSDKPAEEKNANP